MSRISEFQSANRNNCSKNKTMNSSNVSEADIQDKFNTYKDMSKEELNSQLFKEVARQKSQGTFDYDGLERMVESLKGSLNDQQYNNIKRLLENLK